MACTTAIPPLTGFSVVPDINMTDSAYCAAVLTYYSELGIFITQTNNILIWIQATAEAACTAKDEAQTSATNAANSAILAEQFADAAAVSAFNSENSATNSQISALESLESASIAAALANLQFGGFYVLDGELYAEYNNLAISTPQIIDGEFIVEWI